MSSASGTSVHQATSSPAQTSRPSQRRGANGGLFLMALLKHLPQGVIAIDNDGLILMWNDAVESMTGIAGPNVIGKQIRPAVLGLSDAHGVPIAPEDSPFEVSVRTGREIQGQFRILGKSRRELTVQMQLFPVRDRADEIHGGLIFLNDESIQAELKRKLKDLHAASTLDPLTHVANRAEFERVLDEYVETHHAKDMPCSLIVTDIDFFKSINDSYGHHVGDQALTTFAGLLTQFVRDDDFVARYGGEEFVILCANCDLASAMKRAETIRQGLMETNLPFLDGKCLTASFGVSQLRPTDEPTDFFVRADRALLKAKELGRNRVVEASASSESTMQLTSPEVSNVSGAEWRRIPGKIITSREYITNAPMPVIVQKIGGYVRETDAEIVKVEEDHTTLNLTQIDPVNKNRKGRFLIDIELQEVPKQEEHEITRTMLRITFRPQRTGMFRKNAEDTYHYALQKLGQFLMVHDLTSMLKVDAAATDSGRSSG